MNNIFLKTISLAVLILCGLPACSQNDAEAMLKALRPVIVKYQGVVNVDSTDLFNTIFAKYKKDKLTLIRIADMFYNRENPDSAAAHRVENRILKAHPKYGYVYTLRGANDIGLYQDQAAGLANMRKAIDISPDDPRCYVPYVEYRLDPKREPTRADSLELRALVEALSKRVKSPLDQIKVVDMLARFDNGRSEAGEILADIRYDNMVLAEIQNYVNRLVLNKQNDRAQEVLDNALMRFPNDPFLHQTALTFYNNTHQYAKAEEMAERYFAEVPTDSLKPNDYRMYANCLKERGAYAEAVENLWKGYEAAAQRYNAHDASLLQRYIGSDLEECYKAWAWLYGSDGIDGNAEEVFRRGIKTFKEHGDEYRTRLLYHDLADFFTEKASKSRDADEKAEFHDNAVRIYKEFTAYATDETNITMGCFLQWYQAYNAYRAQPAGREFTTYATAYLDRVLTHKTLTADDRKYLYNPILALANIHETDKALDYANRLVRKFGSASLDPKIEELVKKIKENGQ